MVEFTIYECIFQRLWPNIHINEVMVRQGLGKISDIHHIENMGNVATNQNLLLYLDRLVQLEHKAATKGVGMWTQSEKSENGLKKGLSVFKLIVTGPYHLIKKAFNKMKKKE